MKSNLLQKGLAGLLTTAMVIGMLPIGDFQSQYTQQIQQAGKHRWHRRLVLVQKGSLIRQKQQIPL